LRAAARRACDAESRAAVECRVEEDPSEEMEGKGGEEGERVSGKCEGRGGAAAAGRGRQAAARPAEERGGGGAGACCCGATWPAPFCWPLRSAWRKRKAAAALLLTCGLLPVSHLLTLERDTL